MRLSLSGRIAWVAALALLLTTSTVQADTVTATLGSLQSGTVVSDGIGGQGGAFNWSGATYNPNPAFVTLGNFPQLSGQTPAGTSFETFCIETGQNVGYNNSYTYTLTGNLASAPVNNNPNYTGMGATAAQNLEVLFALEFYNPTQGLITGVDYGAMQLAIWTIVSGSTTLSSTLINANSSNTSDPTAVTNAENYLSAVAANPNGYYNGSTYYLANYLVALTNSSYQDQIGINDPNGNIPSVVVPVPPAVAMALTGVIGLLGYGLRRRKPALV
jgi:hypothetical protein